HWRGPDASRRGIPPRRHRRAQSAGRYLPQPNCRRSTLLSASVPFPLQDRLANMRKLLRRLRPVADRSEPFPCSSSRSRAIRWVRSDPLFRNAELLSANLTLRAPSKPSDHFRCAFPLLSVPAAIEHWNTQDRSQTNSSQLNGWRGRNSVSDSQAHLLRLGRPDPRGMSLDIPAVPARRKRRP